MSEVQWIKLAVSIFDSNRKIKQIETMKNGDTILVIWFKLLCLAGKINDGGVIYITPNVPYTTEGLADELRRPIAVVKTALDTFESYGMILRDDMGFIRLSSWEKHQNVDRLAELREYNRIAQQKSRERKKSKEVNDKSMTSQRCQGTEEEREEELEKEDSFTHSCARENISKNEFSTQLSTDLSTREETKRKLLGGELGAGVVFLSDEQYDDLFERLSFEEFQYYIGVVRDQELQGKHYKKKTHYRAILDMAMKDRKI